MSGRNNLPRGSGYMDRLNAESLVGIMSDQNRVRGPLMQAMLGRGIAPSTAAWTGGLLDMMPLVGDASAFEDAYQGFSRGDMIGGGAAALGAILGMVPGVGDAASKVVRSAADGAGGASKGIRAYHGSPHDFDRFDMSKIGTGEGAQAYGHGLYFAESEGVARSYRDNLGTWRTLDDRLAAEPQNRALQGAKWLESGADTETLDKAYRALEPDSTQEIRDEWIRGAEKEWAAAQNAGRMYEVNINADPDDFLDWDKPLSEQPERVRQRLGWTQDVDARYRAALEGADILGSMINAEKIANEVGFTLGERGSDLVQGPASTERLRAAGIPGIRYLDQGSRAAGEGSRNYVVFDDSLIEIIRKYGIAGLMAMGGLSAMTPPAEEY